MKFTLIIDKTKDEEVVVTAKEPSPLCDRIRQLVQFDAAPDRIAAYRDEEILMLSFPQIECITVLDGKTYAIDGDNRRYLLKLRLYELEQILPSYFIRINKSSLANEKRLAKFVASFRGAVDAVFQCGYSEYVSRRCFAEIKRRYKTK